MPSEESYKVPQFVPIYVEKLFSIRKRIFNERFRLSHNWTLCYVECVCTSVPLSGLIISMDFGQFTERL